MGTPAPAPKPQPKSVPKQKAKAKPSGCMSAAERAAFINSAQSIVNRSRANTNRTLNNIGYTAQKLKHKNIGKVQFGFGGSKRTGGNGNVMVKHKDGSITEDNPCLQTDCQRLPDAAMACTDHQCCQLQYGDFPFTDDLLQIIT